MDEIPKNSLTKPYRSKILDSSVKKNVLIPKISWNTCLSIQYSAIMVNRIENLRSTVNIGKLQNKTNAYNWNPACHKHEHGSISKV